MRKVIPLRLGSKIFYNTVSIFGRHLPQTHLCQLARNGMGSSVKKDLEASKLRVAQKLPDVMVQRNNSSGGRARGPLFRMGCNNSKGAKSSVAVVKSRSQLRCRSIAVPQSINQHQVHLHRVSTRTTRSKTTATCWQIRTPTSKLNPCQAGPARRDGKTASTTLQE